MSMSKKPFLKYFDNKITLETLMREIGINDNGFAANLCENLEEELETQDYEMLEFLIYELMIWEEKGNDANGLTLTFFKNILNSLIVCEWHEQHENIVMLIQKISDEDSIDYLFNAIHLKLSYLEWDDNYSFQTKCIRAIGNIGGKKAIKYLETLCEDANSIVREISQKQLEKLKK